MAPFPLVLYFTALCIVGHALFSYADDADRPKIIVRRDAAPREKRPGKPTDTNSCQDIRGVPAALKQPGGMKPTPLGKFYHKYTETYGIPILGSSKVSDNAMRRFCYEVRFLLASHSLVREGVYHYYGHFVMMASTEHIPDVPEFSHLKGKPNYMKIRGVYGGGLQNPTTVGGELNAICDPDDPQGPEDVVLHEIAHAAHSLGLIQNVPGWDERLKKAYDNAMAKGLWKGYYNSNNRHEYFASGTQAYFNSGYYLPKVEGQHGPITTRDRLRVYDPDLYELIWEAFPCDNPYIRRCQGTRAKEDKQLLMMNCNLGGQKHSYCHGLRKHHTHCKDDPAFMDKFCPGVCAANEADSLTDATEKCARWSRNGECSSNPGYMTSNCAKSCFKIKNREAANQHTNCPLWAKKGFCKVNYADYMAANCRESCMNPDPKDENTNCKFWASIGKCESNPRYMIPNCPVSCEQSRASIFREDNPSCKMWANKGFCVKSPSFMMENCERTCYEKMMNPKIVNKKSDCRSFGPQDDQMKATCGNYKRYMAENCEKSCLEVVFAYLSDKKSRCQQRAARGECDQLDMIVDCPTFCFSPAPPRLIDSEPDCDKLSSFGWCADTNNYMGVYCPKSCGVTK